MRLRTCRELRPADQEKVHNSVDNAKRLGFLELFACGRKTCVVSGSIEGGVVLSNES